MNKYRCPKCGRILERNNDKKWIISWCESSDQYARLQKLGQLNKE